MLSLDGCGPWLEAERNEVTLELAHLLGEGLKKPATRGAGG